MVISTGSVGAQSLSGENGSDTLSGGDGPDTLIGGAGDDRLFGWGPGDPSGGRIDATLIADFGPPTVWAASPPGNPDLLFVATIPGLVFVMNLAAQPPQVLPAPALALGPVAQAQQLLGFAFHPDYADNGRIFFHYTRSDGAEIIAEYRALDADTINPASGRILVTIPYEPGSMNKGGWLGFGPDGLLYITTGDGGGENPPDPTMGGIAQDPTSLRGKVLRIDVDSPPDAGLAYAVPDGNPFATGGGAPEIWALGLRNPFRGSFDSDGNFYLVDVGERFAEELNVVPPGQAGLNFGWPRIEGNTLFSDDVVLGPGTLTGPTLAYDPASGNFPRGSITGGFLYEGPGGANGLYFFGDFVEGTISTTRIVNGSAVETADRSGQLLVNGGAYKPGQLVSFAVDGSGRLYTLKIDGQIHRLTPSAGAGDGDDRLIGGGGDDELVGGAGTDTAVYGGGGSDYLVTRLDDGRLSIRDMRPGGPDGTDTVSQVEAFEFSDGVRTLLIPAVVEGVSDGKQGYLAGRAQSDELHALDADSDGTQLRGNAGNDLLTGGRFADFLIGNAGDDVLVGGEGGDQFRFFGDEIEGSSDTDRVYDLDFAEGDRLVFGSFAEGTFARMPGVNAFAGGTAVIVDSFGDLQQLDAASDRISISRLAEGSDVLVIQVANAAGQVQRIELSDAWQAYLDAAGMG